MSFPDYDKEEKSDVSIKAWVNQNKNGSSINFNYLKEITKSFKTT